MTTSSYVGIDVSKDRLDVVVLEEERGGQVDNTLDGIACLVEPMQELQPALIVVEATGGYQRAVVEALFRAGLAVAVVNPARVRQFARACGLLAKTDKLDARVLAVFGQRVQPRRYEGKSEAEQQLSALLVRRKQVCNTSYPPRHFVVVTKVQTGGSYAPRSSGRIEDTVQARCP